MRALRLLAALLALSGVGGLHAAAHAFGGDHSHAHDEAVPHSHEHDADHHGHDVETDGPSEARLLPSRAALPSAPDATIPAPRTLTAQPAGQIPLLLARLSGAPPGRRIPPLSSRAPPV